MSRSGAGSQPYVRKTAGALLLLLLFLAAWVPRMLVVDAYVTPDERKWLNRSGNFYWSVAHGDLAGTFQREHPGVTILWAGTLGFLERFPAYAQQVTGPISDLELETWLPSSTAHTPLEMLVAGRRYVVWAMALALTCCFFPLRRLFGAWAAALGVLALAWDPFTLGLSVELHPSGLLGALTALAFLSFLAWLYAGRTWRYLALSGITLGLALLTEMPAAVVAPVAGLLTLIEVYRGARATGWRGEWGLIGRLILWGVLAAAVFCLLWPVMWIQPLDVLTRMSTQLEAYVEFGHALPNYFLGQPTADPGPLYYPAVWLLRTTPLSLTGVLLGVVWAMRGRWPMSTPPSRRAFWAMLAFAIIYGIAASLAAKKFDRYLLPSFLVLDVAAVLGCMASLDAVVGWWQRRRPTSQAAAQPTSRTAAGLLTGGLLVLAHALPGFVTHPYYIAYYNPLVGGSRTAPGVLMTGWGEGLDAAAGWLNQQPGADMLRVASWYGDGPLSYYLKSRQPVSNFQTMGLWFDYDYLVTYINQWQRENPEPDIFRYLDTQTPAFVAHANGMEVARVYDRRGKAPPPFTQIYTDKTGTFGTALRLAAYHLSSTAAQPGDTLKPGIFLKPLGPIEQTYAVRLRLVAPDGQVVWQEERPPAAMDTRGWPQDEIREDSYRIELPASLAPAIYTLDYAVFDAESGIALPVHPTDRAPGGAGTTLPFAEIRVDAPRTVPVDVRWSSVALTSLQHAAALRPGDTLLVNMATAPQPGEQAGGVKLSLRLLDETGAAVAQQDKDIAPALRWTLPVPDSAAPGIYTLVAVLYRGDTLEALPDSAGQMQSQLSTVAVKP